MFHEGVIFIWKDGGKCEVKFENNRVLGISQFIPKFGEPYEGYFDDSRMQLKDVLTNESKKVFSAEEDLTT